MLVKQYQVRDMPTARDIIESGRLRVGDRNIGRKLAKFDRLMRAACFDTVKDGRRIGTVGSMTGVLQGGTQSLLNLAWSALGALNPTAPVINGPPNTAIGKRSQVTYTYGTTLTTDINQIMQSPITDVVNGTALAFAMSVWAKNVFNDASATLTAVKEWLVEVLTTAQGGTSANPLSAVASSVTCGDSASNAWAGILNSTGTYTINGGGCWYHNDQSAAGAEVTAADVLKTINNDGTNTHASLRFTAFGFK